jgi:predicted transcriptional regulator
MDPIDEKIISLLRDDKTMRFEELLSKVGYSHNTLRLHLNKLTDEGVILKSKLPSEGHGGPSFMYSAVSRPKRVTVARLTSRRMWFR